MGNLARVISAQASLNSVTVRGDMVATRPTTDILVTGSGMMSSNGSINKILIGGSVRVEDVTVGSLQFGGRNFGRRYLGLCHDWRHVIGASE